MKTGKFYLYALILVFFLGCTNKGDNCHCRIGESFGLLQYNLKRAIDFVDTAAINSGEKKFLRFALVEIDSVSNYLVMKSGGFQLHEGRKYLCDNGELLTTDDIKYIKKHTYKVEILSKKLFFKKEKYTKRIDQYIIYNQIIKRPEFDSSYISSNSRISLALDFLALGNDLSILYLLAKE